mgnify:CR=1 FL=1
MVNKNYCYIHACNINNGLDILKELLDKILSSTLDTVLEKIRISILGPISKSTLDNIQKYNPKIEIIYTNNNIKLYEYPTLKLIHQFSIENDDCNILYMHTKGANSPQYEGEHEWRKYMQHYLVNNFELCLDLLENYHTVGCELHKDKFYAGNFWWAQGQYIQQLKDPFIYLNDFKHYIQDPGGNFIPNRFFAESWLLQDYQNTKPNFYNFINTGASRTNKISLSDYKDSENPQLFYYNQLRKQNMISKQEYCHFVKKECNYSCNNHTCLKSEKSNIANNYYDIDKSKEIVRENLNATKINNNSFIKII